MFYSLTSTRDVGLFTQVVCSFQKHSASSSSAGQSSSVIALHTAWRTALANLDGASWETGSLKLSNLVELDDGKTDNEVFSSNAGDISVTICTEVSGTVYSTAFKVKNVGVNELVTAIRNKYLALTGRDLDNASVKNNTYVTNLTVNMHKKESA